jgi:hypothetical protein
MCVPLVASLHKQGYERFFAMSARQTAYQQSAYL